MTALYIALVIVPVISLLTKKPNEEHIKQVFSCYDSSETMEVKK